ncbi:MAG: response regulator transcription factor [Candidatus Sumerlaeia bacterium]|nr:response regulator transcription factor [Candidatus Sumerlaeia bacterium]
MNMPPKIRVLLADDHIMVREGLRRVLEDSGLIEIVGEAADGVETIQKAESTNPDVILLDISMPGMTGLEAVGRLRAILPRAGILILTMHDNVQYAYHALQAGANGFLLKQAAATELIKAIKAIREGKTYVTAEIADRLMNRLARPHTRPPVLESLSTREFEVFTLLGQGRTVREVAKSMGLSERTVSTYRSRLMEKLQVRNTAELIRLAMETGHVK